MQRVILHCDMNNFYASVECMLNPELKNKPVVVCGSVEERHGIVLAKNYVAKAFGVSTGEATWKAKQKCQDLVIVEPHYCAVSLIFNITTASYSDAVVNVGYKEFNLILASSVRNCQFTFAATVFRSTSHADNSLRRFEILSILLFKHCLVMTLSSISAISSQLPCFGV